MTKERAIKAIDCILNDTLCDGCIGEETTSCVECRIEVADMAIEALQQKTGKWIECDSSEHWKCSECGCRASYWFNEENSSSYDLDMSEWLSDYCPSCGAKMI